MSEKLQLKEKIAAVDQNIRELWDALDEENQKALKNELYILNRYISNVKTQKRETQEYFVFAVNEYYNKHWFQLSKHPKLLWLLLCMCSYDGESTFYHEWIGYKKKDSKTSKKASFLEEIYPQMKNDELELLARISTDREIKEFAKELGIEDNVISKKLK